MSKKDRCFPTPNVFEKKFHPVTSSSLRTILEAKLRAMTSPWDRLPLLIQLTRWRGDAGFVHRCAIEAFNLAKELNDKFWIARSLQALSDPLLRNSQQSEAIRHLKEASRIFAQLNERYYKAEADLSLGQLLTQQGEYNTAMKVLLEAGNIFKAADNPQRLALAYGAIGDIYRIVGDHSRGIKYYQRAVAVAHKSDLVLDIGGFYQQLALSYRMMEDSRNFRRYLFKSLVAHRQVDNISGIAIALGNIANSYIDQESFSTAEKYIRQSGKLYRKLGYLPHEANAWGKLGRIYEHKGERAKALYCHKRGLAIALQGEDKVLLGTLYESLGSFYVRRGRSAQGIRYLKKGVEILDEKGEMFYRCHMYQTLAKAYEEIGDDPNALKYYKRYTLLKEEYIGNQKFMQTSRTEVTLRLRTLTRRLKKERSENKDLKKKIEEQEAALITLTLNLVRKGEERRKGYKTINCAEDNPQDALSGNWDLFARQFHKVHHAFYFKLLRDYPELTVTELKVCSLIRIGLSSKEIGDLLCISVRTVDRHREGIRKCLQLPPRFSLSKFIAGL